MTRPAHYHFCQHDECVELVRCPTANENRTRTCPAIRDKIMCSEHDTQRLERASKENVALFPKVDYTQ